MQGMARRRTSSYDESIVFVKDGDVFKMPLPFVFEMAREELIDFLPRASQFWLFCTIIALYDKIMER